MKKICQYCGKEYETKSNNSKFCSVKCRRDNDKKEKGVG